MERRELFKKAVDPYIKNFQKVEATPEPTKAQHLSDIAGFLKEYWFHLVVAAGVGYWVHFRTPNLVDILPRSHEKKPKLYRPTPGALVVYSESTSKSGSNDDLQILLQSTTYKNYKVDPQSISLDTYVTDEELSKLISDNKKYFHK